VRPHSDSTRPQFGGRTCTVSPSQLRPPGTAPARKSRPLNLHRRFPTPSARSVARLLTPGHRRGQRRLSSARISCLRRARGAWTRQVQTEVLTVRTLKMRAAKPLCAMVHVAEFHEPATARSNLRIQGVRLSHRRLVDKICCIQGPLVLPQNTAKIAKLID